MKTKKKVTKHALEEELINENATNGQQESAVEVENNDNLAEDEQSENWEEKYNELNNTHLRLLAEFDNYRKRTLKEKADLIKTGGERIFADILPVIDDLERALETVEKSDNVEVLKEGVDLIYSKFKNFLSKNGLKEINVIGEVFDTEKHEAITTIPAQSDDQKDKVIECIQKGYVLDEKMIRFPKVIVAK